MNEILQKLSEPMEYKTRKGPSGMTLNYIDARQVMDRLDEVMGINWSCNYNEYKGHLYCSVALFLDGQWISRSDCGDESNIEATKGESSDAFKRAAVKWGVGRFLYQDLPSSNIESKKEENKIVSNPGTTVKCSKCGKELYEHKTITTKYGPAEVFNCPTCLNDKGYPLGTFLKK